MFHTENESKSFVVTNRDTVAPFTTKDGSTIREILAPRGPAEGVIRNQSLAEATLAPGASTDAHRHPRMEEIYYILRGDGFMEIGPEGRRIGPGDGIAIPPGAVHRITNIAAAGDLVFLCCCAPAYSHDDTVMVDLPPHPALATVTSGEVA